MAVIKTQKEISSNDLILQLSGLGCGWSVDSGTIFPGQNEFLAAAAKEGCTGLIYYNLTSHRVDLDVPEDALSYLKQEYSVNLGRNLLIDNQLSAICSQFEESKIRALTVRGAQFFDTIYPELGMRPLLDMDFVVRREDFDRVQDILKGLGFENHEAYPFFFAKENIYVDVHINSINFWRIKNWPSAININDEQLMARSVSFRGHTYIRTLDVYDTIIHCCEHLMKHSFERLIWFVDIAYLMRKEALTIEWGLLISRAKEAGAQKAVYYVLSFLEKAHYYPVPEHVLEGLSRIRLNAIEKKNFRLLLNNQRADLSGDLMSLYAIPRFGQRLRALFSGIFIEHRAFPVIQKKLTLLSYIKRFCRLVGLIIRKLISNIKAPSF